MSIIMKKKAFFTEIPNKFIVILLIIIPLICCNRGKKETKINGMNPEVIQTNAEKSFAMQTESLVDALNSMENINYEKRAQLITFINDSLEHNGKSSYEENAYEYSGVKYSYNTNGKFLFISETEFGGAGSSYEFVNSYIFDTELIKLIPPESIFINANSPNPLFNKLVIEYLLKEDTSNMIRREYLPKTDDPITNYGFSLFYAKDGVGLRWNKGVLGANAAGPYMIVLPYSKARDFLTETGKEVYK